MRCSNPKCDRVIKHPGSHMCSRDFGMCKFCAFKFYPQAYNKYRPVSKMFAKIKVSKK